MTPIELIAVTLSNVLSFKGPPMERSSNEETGARSERAARIWESISEGILHFVRAIAVIVRMCTGGVEDMDLE